jgi:hypothetical protein
MVISEEFKLLNLKKNNMREVCTDEVGGVKMKEKYVLPFEKNLFSLRLFFGAPLALHFKDDL